MEFTALDYVIFGVAAFTTAVGLFRGFSGEVGAFAGVVAAAAVGWLLFPHAAAIAAKFGAPSATVVGRVAAFVVDGVLALVAYGLARKIVARFVSFLMPQPTNALVGAAFGFVRALVFVALLLVVGFVQTGSCAMGICAENSEVLRFVGTLADMYVSSGS